MQDDIVKPPAPANKPEPSQPLPPVSTSPEPKSSDSEVHTVPPSADPVHPDTQLSTVQKPRRQRPLGVIFASIAIFLCLAGGAVYVTLQNRKDNKSVASTTQTPAVQTTPAADTSSQIDDALNEAAQLPTSNEDPASDLSDQTLGL